MTAWGSLWPTHCSKLYFCLYFTSASTLLLPLLNTLRSTLCCLYFTLPLLLPLLCMNLSWTLLFLWCSLLFTSEVILWCVSLHMCSLSMRLNWVSNPPVASPFIPPFSFLLLLFSLLYWPRRNVLHQAFCQAISLKFIWPRIYPLKDVAESWSF